MRVGLSGNLADFGLADVFQLIGQQRKTGVLELLAATSRVQLVFDRGAVVSAAPVGRDGDTDPLAEMLVRCGLLTREQVARPSRPATPAHTSCRARDGARLDRASARSRVEDVLTRDTIFEVLRWTKGSFDFRAQAVEHDRDPASLLGAEQILMDGLRMLDEWRELVRAGAVGGRCSAARRPSRAIGTRPGDGVGAAAKRGERVFALIDGRLSVRRVIDLSRVGTFDGTRILTALRERA